MVPPDSWKHSFKNVTIWTHPKTVCKIRFTLGFDYNFTNHNFRRKENTYILEKKTLEHHSGKVFVLKVQCVIVWNYSSWNCSQIRRAKYPFSRRRTACFRSLLFTYGILLPAPITYTIAILLVVVLLCIDSYYYCFRSSKSPAFSQQEHLEALNRGRMLL